MHANFSEIIDTARFRYANYLGKYKAYSPVYFDRRLNKKLGIFSPFLKFFIFLFYGLYLFVFRRSNGASFVFEGTRFSDLHALLPPERVVILGGLRARNYCAQHGYGFEWDGYIKALFLLFYRKNIPLAMRLLGFIARASIGRSVSNGGALFLFEDTVPLGISLSLVLRRCAPVICITHGYTLSAADGSLLLPDGELCRYNVLYDEDQRGVFAGLDSKFFTMGLPYEIPEIGGIDEQIVLVEQAEPDTPEEYEYCLLRMVKLSELLQKIGCSVVYRVRPGVARAGLEGRFPALHQGPKDELLGGGRKIFVGYNSTLLYEAKACGHITIGMNQDGLRYFRRFNTDLELRDLNLIEVQKIVDAARRIVRDAPSLKVKSLKERFGECLSEISQAIQVDGYQKFLKE